jgi:hypothetical protein
MLVVYSLVHVKHDPASLHLTDPGSEQSSHPEIAARGTGCIDCYGTGTLEPASS